MNIEYSVLDILIEVGPLTSSLGTRSVWFIEAVYLMIRVSGLNAPHANQK